MSSHIQALDTSRILFSSRTGFNLLPQGATAPLWRMLLFLTDGENRAYGPELLMKSGANAVSGCRRFEQTVSGPRRSSLRRVTTNTHLLRSRRGKEKNTENKEWGKVEEEKVEEKTAVEQTLWGKSWVGTREPAGPGRPHAAEQQCYASLLPLWSLSISDLHFSPLVL